MIIDLENQNSLIIEDDLIRLLPGSYWFDKSPKKLSTLLGSCVAFLFWHPILHWGGICHYLLPSRQAKDLLSVDARFGDESIEILFKILKRHEEPIHNYQYALLGGACMWPIADALMEDIGDRNIKIAKQLIKKYDISTYIEHVGGEHHRQVTFDLNTGRIDIQTDERCHLLSFEKDGVFQ